MNDKSEAGKIIIYKDYKSFGVVGIYVGEVISKAKTYKIKPIKSGHFNGYKTYVQVRNVIGVIDKLDENIDIVMKNIIETTNADMDMLTEIRNLNRKRKDYMEESAEKLKELIEKKPN